MAQRRHQGRAGSGAPAAPALRAGRRDGHRERRGRAGHVRARPRTSSRRHPQVPRCRLRVRVRAPGRTRAGRLLRLLPPRGAAQARVTLATVGNGFRRASHGYIRDVSEMQGVSFRMGVFEEAKGKVKEKVGEVTDNPDLQREGRAQEKKGEAEREATQARIEAKGHEGKAKAREVEQEAAERAK